MDTKILFYINALLNGGAERVLCNLANQFNKKGYQTVFVTSFPVKDEYILVDGVKRYNLEEKERHEGFVKRNVSRVKKLAKIVKKEKPNLIISFLPEPNFRSIIVSKICNVPCIISVRNDPNQEYKNKSFFYAQKILYPLANGIVFQTEDAKNWFPKNIQKKSTIIMNQVDPKFYAIEHREETYFVAIGRLTEQKNFSLLIKCFAEFLKSHPNNSLRIYGKGNKENELNCLIRSLEIEKRVKLMGQTNNVPEVLSKAKAFIMTSDYEGMPNALLEAMAVGVPVISTDCPCGGPKMIVKHKENGLLVPMRNSKLLLEAIIAIDDSDELRNRIKRNSKKTAEKFKPDVIFSKWEIMYLSL